MVDEICDEIVELERLADFIALGLKGLVSQGVPEGAYFAQKILSSRLADIANRLEDISSHQGEHEGVTFSPRHEKSSG